MEHLPLCVKEKQKSDKFQMVNLWYYNTKSVSTLISFGFAKEIKPRMNTEKHRFKDALFDPC